MTALEDRAPERDRPGLLHRLTHPRAVADQARGDVAANVTALARAHTELLSGRTVRFRWAQMTLWGVVAGLVGAQFIYGLYDGVTQIHWYIHVGGFYRNLFWLKPGWDKNCFGLVNSGNWWLYRHIAFRDIPGAALATMAVKTLLAPEKSWKTRVGTVRIVTGPLVVVALTFALGVAGVYLAYFGLPDLWAHAWSLAGHPGFRVTRLSVLSKLSTDQLLIGFVIGQVLHRYWMPIGATLQGNMLDRSIDRAQYKIRDRAGMPLDEAVRYTNAGLRILPAWQRRPVAPPVLRERFALMWRANTKVDARSGHARVITLVGFVALLIVLLGFTGHYVAGHGITVPYLFPEG